MDQNALLHRLNRAWVSYKNETNATQAKAAAAMGMNQSAFSQYLRGPENGGIPLNTDFLIKFSALTGDRTLAPVSDLVGSACSITPQVLKTVSGVSIGERVMVPVPPDSNNLCAFVVDREGLPFPKDAVLICDTSAEGHEGDQVIMPTDSAPVLGELRHVKNRWVIVPYPALHRDVHYVKDGEKPWPITLIHRPSRGKKFGG